MKRSRRKLKEEPELEETKVEVKSIVADEELIVMEPSTEKVLIAPKGGVSGVRPKEPKSSDMVKVKVLAGTLGWSEGFHEKGEIFEISKEDLKRFDPRYYQIIK